MGFYYKDNEDDIYDENENEAKYNNKSLKKKKKSSNVSSFKPKKKSYDIQNGKNIANNFKKEKKNYKPGKLSFK